MKWDFRLTMKQQDEKSVFRFAMVFFCCFWAPFSLTKLPWMECNYPETSTGMQGSKSRSTILVEDFSFI